MRKSKLYLIILLSVGTINICSAQQKNGDTCSSKDVIFQEGQHTGYFIRGVCKLKIFVFSSFHTIKVSSDESKPPAAIIPIEKQAKLLQVKGNILYDINYRSGIDTPYAEKNIYQHTLQTRLDFVYKERYPFKIYLTTHFSNSSLFREYIDLNFQYRQSDFVRLLKQRIINIAESALLSQTRQLDSLRRLIEWDKANIASLSHSLQKPDINQRLIEKREQNLFGNAKSAGNITNYNPDIQSRIISRSGSKFTSIFQSNSKDVTAENKGDQDLHKIDTYKDSLDEKKKRLDTLITELNKAQKFYNQLESVQYLSQSRLKNEINNATDANSLTRELQQLHIPDTVLPKGYKTLYSIKAFNLGRSVVDYSELSVKDISITGVQAEYNPRYY